MLGVFIFFFQVGMLWISGSVNNKIYINLITKILGYKIIYKSLISFLSMSYNYSLVYNLLIKFFMFLQIFETKNSNGNKKSSTFMTYFRKYFN